MTIQNWPLALLFLLAMPAQAAVTSLTVEKTTPIDGGYVLIQGHYRGALDPAAPRNAIINDIALAPRGADGRVGYSASFAIARPADMTKVSGVLVYDVPNRGKGAAHAVEGGHIDLISGWQGDVSGPGLQTIAVPSAPVRGPVSVRFIDMPAGTTTLPVRGGALGGIGGRNFEPATADGARLYVGHSDNDPLAQREVPRSDWAFADCTAAPFPGKPDLHKLCVKGGFDPKLAYTLSFTAANPPLLGVGYAAVRDLVAFLRHDTGAANPLAGQVRWAVARGVSQSGNFLRGFVHLGFNSAEDGSRVFDGINPLVAMRQNSMNYRFATPGGLASLYEAGSDGINWWSPYQDRLRGLPRASLLDRCHADHACPKVVEILGSSEFWNLRASPDFVGGDARADIPLPPEVRRYYNAGVPHNGGKGGFSRATPPLAACVLASNPNPTAWINRALFRALIDWVTRDVAPPPSRYPTLAAGQLVTPAAYAAAFPKIPGMPGPQYSPLYQYDFGKGFNYADLTGAPTIAPPRILRTIAQLVPRADADGNELDGIRSPLLAAPLGTYTGWNATAAGFEQGRYCGTSGGFIPFAATRAERLAAHDTRPSLQERYPSHAAYVAKVKAAADILVAQRYMLADDAAAMVAQAKAAPVP